MNCLLNVKGPSQLSPRAQLKDCELSQVGLVWLYSLWTTAGNLCQISQLTEERLHWPHMTKKPRKFTKQLQHTVGISKAWNRGSDYQSHHIVMFKMSSFSTNKLGHMPTKYREGHLLPMNRIKQYAAFSSWFLSLSRAFLSLIPPCSTNHHVLPVYGWTLLHCPDFLHRFICGWVFGLFWAIKSNSVHRETFNKHLMTHW